MNNEIAGRLAIVTGGSRGIGREIALALATAGVNVALIYHKEKTKAEEIVVEIKRKNRIAWAFAANLAEPDSLAALAKAIKESCKLTVSILVNNAGVSKKIPLERLSLADWTETITTNLTSAFLLTQTFISDMRRQRWGRIINMSSIAAQTGGVIGPHYAASKAGMQGLTHSYASLLAKEGITVNSIAPAIIETDMIKDVDGIQPSIIPIGRFGEAKEVASMVLELIKNGYVTGQTVNVNGGWYMS